MSEIKDIEVPDWADGTGMNVHEKQAYRYGYKHGSEELTTALARTDIPTLLRVIEKLREQRNHWFNLYAASGSTNELDAELDAIVEGRDD